MVAVILTVLVILVVIAVGEGIGGKKYCSWAEERRADE